ncbi:non-ribosomal peptide synthetase [Gordonia sp. (in: high G+C Gram-positive bacteria)]|uniref:non-ribosomal peptide synthetase n=1 Tax=Gordonia sp. (in: high G+C Gram-positive bacteria) TaxID=84139 RepID=UPI002CB947DD|nr:non-ribosomal peptide synthetase [Gordonia sp. (in: high G+C Gram-positive bacteria)]HMS73958.1 amino acid adenylation domain-containing protein [Gordonia sp. (in: high G+C Gram-positive bacteria)]
MTVYERGAQLQAGGEPDGLAPAADRYVPLSAAQRSIWFAQQLAPGTAFSIAQYVDVSGELDTYLLTDAGRQVAREFGTGMVRLVPASIVADGDNPTGAPFQAIDDEARVEFIDLDLRTESDPEAAARAWMDDEFRGPLDLFADRLLVSVTLRIADRRWFWYSRVHHILLDGYGSTAFTERVAQVYTGRILGIEVQPSRAGSLADLYADDLAYRSSTRFERDREHWAGRLADLPAPIRLGNPGAGAPTRSRSVGGDLDQRLLDAVSAFCADNNVTVAAVATAATALYLSRMSGHDDVALSLPVSARTNALLRRSGGMVSNVVPIRAKIGEHTTVAEYLAQVAAELSGALRHQRFRFEDMTRQSDGAVADRGFFGPVVNIMMFRGETTLGHSTGRSYVLSTGPIDDLAFTVYTGGGDLRIDIEANADAYSADDLDGHHRRLCTVLAALAGAPAGARIARLDVLDPDSRSRLVPARGPLAAVAEPVPDLLARVRATHPDVTALIDGETTLRYDELAQRVHRLARVLLSHGIGPGRQVAVLLPRGVNSVTTTLAVFATGATFVPIDPALPDDRIAYLLEDSGAEFGVAGHAGDDRFAELPSSSPAITWLRLDDPALIAGYRAATPEPVTDADRPRRLTVDDVAYLIYTSGSTGRPKGVAISHRGLSSFAAEQNARYGVGPGARTVHFASPSFDAAILELLLAFASGATLVVVPPDVYGGIELGRMLRAERITHLFLTPAALASVPHADPAVTDGLPDLGTIIVGGEACPPDLVARWASGRRMFNAYGPTESTVMVTLAGPLEPGGEVPIGTPITGTTVVVLDRRLLPVPVGATGELYLGGVGLARGYHRRESLTAARFVADPYGPPGARLYRTGDLVCWNENRQLVYRGRADRQIKIRGFRVELGEIDAAITSIDGVETAITEPQTAPGPATSAATDLRTVLVGYFTGTADPAEIRERLHTLLPAHMVPAAIMHLDALPLTSSGKINREELPVPVLRSGPYSPPGTPAEERVAAAFAACARAERAGRDDDFFALGGDSLAATRLVAELGHEFGIDIPVRWVFESPTVATLARRLDDASAVAADSAAMEDAAGGPGRLPMLRHSTSDGNIVPVSPQQKRMWIVNRFDTESTIFHIPFALRLRGTLDVAALSDALVDVLDRHETLRTVYPDSPEGPIQQVLPLDRITHLTDPVRNPRPVAAEDVLTRIGDLAATGFDVSEQVPLALTLLRVDDADHVLVCVVHHIAADGSSSAPLALDLARAYSARCHASAPEWQPLPVTYRDYTRWHHELMGSESDPASVSAVQLEYWRIRLQGLPDLLALPTDRPRPAATAADNGGHLTAEVAPDQVARVRAVAAAHGVTAFMVAHAVLAVLLARLSGSADIAVGTPVAGRGHRDLAGLVGMFAGTLVLRTEIRSDHTFAQVLQTVRDADLGAFENADIPFDRLVDLMKPRRSAAYHPLFQVGFSYQNISLGHFTLDGVDVEVIEPELGVAKSDLHLTLVDNGEADAIAVRWDYDRDLFDHSTIERWHDLWTALLTGALGDADTPVGDLRVDSAAATSELMGAVSGRPAGTLTGLLERAFTRYADAEALWVDGARSVITYRQLSVRVNRLAGRLIAAGVGPEVRVAVAIERSAELIEAVLAVLVAGGAYVPVDPGAPAERNRLVLESVDPALLLVAGGVPDGLPRGGITLYDIISGEVPAELDADEVIAAVTRPANTAYIIYTSGSTGAPKGVAVSHGAIASQLCWKAATFPIGTGDTLVLRTNLTFDLSVWELFWPLISGARLAVAEPGGDRDPRYLAALMARAGVTAAHFVPSLLDAHLDAIADAGSLAHPLGRVLCIGEALNPATARRAAEVLGARVFNLYGPTEAAVGITCHEWETDTRDGGTRDRDTRNGTARAGSTVAIGTPADDSAAVVLDSRLHRVPDGVAGELYLGGVQLARAYHGRPDLTAARFVADPSGGGRRLYRTGDTARVGSNGQLEFLGRNDFQVKIRGQRIELGEIEAALAADPRVASAVVAAHEEVLVAYLVPDSAEPGWDGGAVLEDLAAHLPAYMIPAVSLTLSELPRGIHGKVDRAALPTPPRTRREYRAPRTGTERALIGLLGDLLPGAIPDPGHASAAGTPLGVTDDFFDRGGNSLIAARLSARIEDAFGVSVPVRTVLDFPEIGQLAARLEEASLSGRPRLTTWPRPDRIPLSRQQLRMWLLDQLDPGTGVYNLPLALRIDGHLDQTAFAVALRHLLDRHESLRTIYPVTGGMPHQLILGADDALAGADITLPVEMAPTPARVLADSEMVELLADIAARGFDLGSAIPLRIHVITEAADRHVVVIVVHHIVADGWSIRLLFTDLIAGYLAAREQRRPEGAGLGPAASDPAELDRAEPLPIHYADYAMWRAALLDEAHPSIAGQYAFWDRTLAALPGPLPLPLDRPRRAHPTGIGATIAFEIEPELVAAASAYARARNATLFHMIHAAFAIMLSRLSDTRDIVIGTPVSGRPSALLDEVVGMFVETVVLRTDVDPDARIDQFIDAVRMSDTAAQDNSEVPFDDIAARYEADPGGAHHPVFQVMLAAGDPAPGPMTVDGLTVAPVEIDLPVARFDLHLTIDLPVGTGGANDAVREAGQPDTDQTDTDQPGAGAIRGRLTYATDIFDHRTVARFPGMLRHVLHALTTGLRTRVHDIDIVPAEEMDVLLSRLSHGPQPVINRCQATLPELLAANASLGRAAVVRDDSGGIGAAEFRRRVARTARALIDRGVGPESTVAVAVARSIDMLVAIHAVVSAGGAYVPLDPDQPPVRLAGMLATADPVVVIATAATAELLPPGYADRLFEPGDRHAARSDAVVDDHDRRTPLLPAHPAYVLFTSGSTGTPKAVSVSHEAIVNRLCWMQQKYPIGHTHTVLQKTPITFDVSVWELFWPFISGASVVLAAPGAHRDPAAIAQIIREHAVSVVHFVPTMLDAFLAAPIPDSDLESLRLVFTSGEALAARTGGETLRRTLAAVHNLYGPTEAAVDVTAHQVGAGEAGGRSIPIGRPTAGNEVYVLDSRLRPVAAGVVGELYLGGVQLARGYHGSPALTACRFVASPWDVGRRLYRTGDLVTWRQMPDGELALDYIGRSDFQVKIRGQRVESGEIEAVLLAYPDLAAAVVLVHDDPVAGQQLVAYVVVDEDARGDDSGSASAPDIRRHVARHLPDHMVPAHVVVLTEIPVTTSGKVDRRALPAPAAGEISRRGGSGTDGRTPTETVILDIIRPLLGDRVGRGDDFFDMGGNSLIAMKVVAAIHTSFGVRLPVRAVFDARTPEAMAAMVDGLVAEWERSSLGERAHTDRSGHLPLSAAQQQMWLHNRISPSSSAFMIVAPLRIPGRLDPAVLPAAIGDVIDRHEILRTSYPETGDGPVQVVRDVVPGDLDRVVIVMDEVAAGHDDPDIDECVRAALDRPLDLTADLPLRVAIRPSGEFTDVVLAIHHIAADGWSLRVLAGDLNLAYTARAAGTAPDRPPLPVQYADHVLARSVRLGSADDPSSELAGHLAYWRAALGDAPSDAAPARDGSGGAAELHRIPVDPALLREIDRIAVRYNTTRFAVVHAALAVTLSRSGAGRDIIVGTPVAGRSDGDVVGLVGMFVSMVALRSDVDPQRGFGDLVVRSRETILDGLDHSAVDVEEVIDHLGIGRDGSRHPLIAVTLTVDADEHPVTTGGAAALTEAAVRIDLPVARFDLEFAVTPTAGGGAELTVVHRPEAYRAATAAALLAGLDHVLHVVVANPDVALRELDLLTDAEHATMAALSGPPPVAPRFLDDVLATPGYRLAGYDRTGRWTRWDHDTVTGYSARLARVLRARGAGPETVVALCIGRSPESVAAMRAVATTGAAFVPIDPAYPADRIAFMIGDSGAGVIVTTSHDRARLTGVDAVLLNAAIDADAPDLSAPADHEPHESFVPNGSRHIDQLAYLIYTSGSTGIPKAVAVTHRGVASFVAEQRRYRVDADSRVLHFASPSFDAAMLEILLAADAGATTVVAPTTLYGSDDLTALLREESVTHAFLTPGVLETITPAPPEPDPLPALSTLIVGGDACAPATARRWITLGKRFFNAFGPTETTVMATLAGPLTEVDTTPMLIGPGVTGARIRVLDDVLTGLPPGVDGELYVAGPGLARGYHDRPALTAATFVADPDGPPGSRRYRTGDLVRAVTDHRGVPALTHQGRADRQLKIRGHRVETGEIEAILRANARIGGAVVTSATGPDGTTALVAYVVPADSGADTFDVDGLRIGLRGRLPGYAVPSSIMVLGAIPLTTAGKVDQRALPVPIFGESGYAAPESAMQQLVVEVFCEVLHRDRVGVRDNFFDAGGTSLSAASAVARIRSRAGRELSVPDLFDAPTAMGLATLLENAAVQNGPEPGELPRPDRIPLSPAQQRMWFLNRFDPSALTENIPLVLRITGDLDVAAFGAALRTLVARHEVLRTSYPDSPQGPFQKIHPVADAGVELIVTDVDQASPDEAVRSVAAVAFDVTAEVPVRAVLLRERDRPGGDHRSYVFVLVLHHICADGLSVVTLAAQLAADYAALRSGGEPDRTPDPVQYADFAIWQRARLDDPDGPAATELAQWRERLTGAPPVVDLPTDRPRPADPSGRGGRIDFRIDDGLWSRVTDFAAHRGLTPFMVTHTALAVLLGRIGDNRDVVIGTHIAGRDQSRLDAVVGMFVNMLALRTVIDPAATGEQALAQARSAALHGFAHSEIPFDRIVETLDLPRSTAHHPVFQVAFSFQNLGPIGMTLPGAEVEVIDDDQQIAEFDLHLTLAENRDAEGGSAGVTGQLGYASDLFDESTAVELSERYVRLLGALVEFPGRPVGDLPLLAPAELDRLSASAPPARHTEPGLTDGFYAQALRTPDADAVVTSGEVLSYRELVRRVTDLAALIAGHGVGPDDRVAVTAPRSLYQVLALYAVATVGAAYVPVDLTAGERATLILNAADPALVLGVGPAPAGDRPYLDLTALPTAPTWVNTRRSRPDNSAYVLFTSGSTGVPKGVDVSIGAVTEQLRWMQDRYPMGAGDTVVLKIPAGFDVSVWEYWWPLRTGARIVVAEPGAERDGRALLDIIVRHEVSMLATVPSALAMLLDAVRGPLPGSLRAILCIGEELPAETVVRLRATGSSAVLHNLYGPTEAAVSATGYEVRDDHEYDRVPIGTAQPSVVARVLDARLRPVPDGVAGELYLGGVQLARGYRGNAARTSITFVADPVDGSRMYRTGDLVRRMRDGNISYLGRTDHQLKIRGFRIEPGEIEAVLRQCDGVADAVVTTASDRLIGFITATATGPDPDTGLPDTGLADAVGSRIAHRLPDYMRPEIHVLEEFPYNTNGKVDRGRLPAPALARSGYEAPRPGIELRVAEIIADVTGAPRVGRNDSFFDVGGNSLSATRVASRLEDESGRRVPVRLLFDSVDIADLARRLAEQPPISDGPVLVRGSDELTGPIPLAPAQRRIWDSIQAGAPSGWNVPFAIRFTGDLDPAALTAAVLDVLDRHEALRTGYRQDADGAVMLVRSVESIRSHVEACLRPASVADDALVSVLSELAWTPLDVTADLPIRLRLLRIGDDAHILVLTVSHLNLDGGSTMPFARDVLTAFTARSAGTVPQLPVPAVRYADYARWKREMLGTPGHRTPEFTRQLSYWTNRLDIDGADAAARHRRNAVAGDARPRWDADAGVIEFGIDSELHTAIDDFARSSGVGAFAVLQAAFAVVLAHRAGDPQVRVATANANRARTALAEVIGNFSEDLPMLLDAADSRTFADLVGEVGAQLLAGLAHPDISVPDLLEAAGIEKDAAGCSGDPIFPATLILQEATVDEADGAEIDLGTVRVRRETIPGNEAKHELEFTIVELRDGLIPVGMRGTLLYPVALHSRTSADSVVRGLLAVLAAATGETATGGPTVGELRALLR